jgi:hypothetical protein
VSSQGMDERLEPDVRQEMSKALIILSRVSGPRRDRRSQYKVRIDGQTVGRIAADEVKRFEVGPGPHTVELRVAWAGSPAISVDVASGETIRLTCSAREDGYELQDLIKSIVVRSCWINLWQVRDEDELPT